MLLAALFCALLIASALIIYRSETSSLHTFATMITIAIDINFADIQAPLANDVIPTTGIIVLFICAFINYFAVNKYVLNRVIFH